MCLLANVITLVFLFASVVELVIVLVFAFVLAFVLAFVFVLVAGLAVVSVAVAVVVAVAASVLVLVLVLRLASFSLFPKSMLSSSGTQVHPCPVRVFEYFVLDFVLFLV